MLMPLWGGGQNHPGWELLLYLDMLWRETLVLILSKCKYLTLILKKNVSLLVFSLIHLLVFSKVPRL
jgi:hypothetical protein